MAKLLYNNEVFDPSNPATFIEEVLRIVRHPKTLSRYPFLEGKTPEIRIDGRVSGAYQCGNRVVFGPKMVKTWVILHELTHWILWIERRTKDIKWMIANPEPPAHGWQFCKAYIDLCGLFLSYREMDYLKEAFRKHGVRYNAPRQLSEETKQALRDRMTKMQVERKAARALFTQPYDMTADYAKD